MIPKWAVLSASISYNCFEVPEILGKHGGSQTQVAVVPTNLSVTGFAKQRSISSAQIQGGVLFRLNFVGFCFCFQKNRICWHVRHLTEFEICGSNSVSVSRSLQEAGFVDGSFCLDLCVLPPPLFLAPRALGFLLPTAASCPPSVRFYSLAFCIAQVLTGRLTLNPSQTLNELQRTWGPLGKPMLPPCSQCPSGQDRALCDVPCTAHSSKTSMTCLDSQGPGQLFLLLTENSVCKHRLLYCVS